MILRAIRKGEEYGAKGETYGCVPRRAACDGLLVEGEDGYELVPVADVEAELEKLRGTRPTRGATSGQKLRKSTVRT